MKNNRMSFRSGIQKFRMPIIHNGIFKEWFYWGFIGPLEGEFISPHSNYRNCPSTQFSGLFDKHGNEIYEGDILTVWIGHDRQLIPFLVADNRYLYHQFNRDDPYYRFTDVEIIGNIYETPNLII